MTDKEVFGVQRVNLAEHVVVRSTTKPHEGKHYLVVDLGNLAMQI